MNREIEHKFIVVNDQWRQSVVSSSRIRQGYIVPRGESATVRVRLRESVDGSRGYLTLKSHSNSIERLEFEYEIPPADACEMLDNLAIGHEVVKIRHLVRYAGKLWEIDEFEGENAPLVFAEIELNDLAEAFELPPWVGEDVSLRPEFTNAALAETPWRMRRKDSLS